MAVVVDIDHEAGNLDEWDSLSPSGTGDLQAHVNAALGNTSYGMRVNISDTTSRYGKIAFTPGATYIRARVYLDPNTLTMGTSEDFTFLSFAGTEGIVTHLTLEYTGAAYRCRLRSIEDDASSTSTYTVITDAEHYVEVAIEKGAGTGEDNLWIDGVLQATHSNLNNDTRYDGVDHAKLGTLYLDSGTSGYFYLDELIIRNDNTAIGATGITTSTTTGGTTTTGASTTTLSGSGSTSTITISSTATTTTTTGTTTGATTTAATTSIAPTTIYLRDGPGGHTARAAVGDILKLEGMDTGGTWRETWVEVLSQSDPGAGRWQYGVERRSGWAGQYEEGVTVVNWGPEDGGIIQVIGEQD